MRSQKQTNKAPRPFKSGNTQRGWNGGQGGGFIPGQQPGFRAKKNAPSTPATEPALSPEAAKPDES